MRFSKTVAEGLLHGSKYLIEDAADDIINRLSCESFYGEQPKNRQRAIIEVSELITRAIMAHLTGEKE